jgi:hypothetical protein
LLPQNRDFDSAGSFQNRTVKGMALDTRKLRYFLAVVDHDNFSRAAEYLLIAQPSLSQTIAGLEKDLGVPLFHRIGRRAVLSEAGKELIGPARLVMRDLDAAQSAVQALRLADPVFELCPVPVPLGGGARWVATLAACPELAAPDLISGRDRPSRATYTGAASLRVNEVGELNAAVVNEQEGDASAERLCLGDRGLSSTCT